MTLAPPPPGRGQYCTGWRLETGDWGLEIDGPSLGQVKVKVELELKGGARQSFVQFHVRCVCVCDRQTEGGTSCQTMCYGDGVDEDSSRLIQYGTVLAGNYTGSGWCCV